MRRLDHLSRWACALSTMCLLSMVHAYAEGDVSRYEPTGNRNDVKLNGTSNIHDWSAEGHVIKGYVEITEKQRMELLDGDPPKTLSITDNVKADVTIPVKSLKSDIAGLEEAIWKDMDCKEHPNIRYRFQEADLKHGDLCSGYTFNTKGQLTVNGVTRVLNMHVTIKEPDADEILVKCRTDVKMSDFNIQPPTLLAGLIKAGDAVHITVHWALGRHLINRSED